MDKYLIEILKEVNTIIIPDLGALTIVNHATNEIMFMPYLKYDDGKLAAHIAEKENWEENEAKNLIARYVREIMTKISQGDSYDIYQVGSFFKNAEGDVDFKRWENGTIPTTSEVQQESKAENIAEIPPIEEPTIVEELVIEDPIVEVKTPEPLEEETINNGTQSQTENIPETVTEKTIEESPKILSVEEQLKDDLDIPPVNEKKKAPIKKPILEKTQKDKKKRGAGIYILLAFIALLIAGSAYVGMNYKDFEKYNPFVSSSSENTSSKKEVEDATETTEEIADSQNEVIEESTPEENTEVSDPQNQVTEPIQEDVPTPVNGISVNKSLPIQVIVGSFAEEANAVRKVDQLKSQGIQAEIIGQYDYLYFVSAASFNSMSELNAQKSALSNAGTYWVFKK